LLYSLIIIITLAARAGKANNTKNPNPPAVLPPALTPARFSVDSTQIGARLIFITNTRRTHRELAHIKYGLNKSEHSEPSQRNPKLKSKGSLLHSTKIGGNLKWSMALCPNSLGIEES